MKRTIAFLLADDFEDSELHQPYDALEDAGFDIEVLGLEAGTKVKGKTKKTKVKIEKAVADASIDDYIALVIPGGGSPDHLREHAPVLDFVKRFEETGRPLAAICHGPQLLMAARLVAGRTLTAWSTVQKDLELIPGVTVKDEAVVVDDNLITSRKPEDIEAFNAKILEEIRELEERKTLGDGSPIVEH